MIQIQCTQIQLYMLMQIQFYMLYYICPMHTLFTLMVYACLGIRHEHNDSDSFVMAGMAGTASIFADRPRVFGVLRDVRGDYDNFMAIWSQRMQQASDKSAWTMSQAAVDMFAQLGGGDAADARRQKRGA